MAALFGSLITPGIAFLFQLLVEKKKRGENEIVVLYFLGKTTKQEKKRGEKNRTEQRERERERERTQAVNKSNHFSLSLSSSLFFLLPRDFKSSAPPSIRRLIARI